MMLVQKIFLALFVLLEGEVSCDAEDNDTKLAQAHNRFGLNLLQELSREMPKSNLFFSPTSISVALAMVYAGAKGKSEAELSTALGHTAAGLSSREYVLASYEKILKGLQTDHNVTLDVADVVLVQKKLKVLESYRKELVDRFGAKFQSVDFAAEGSAATAEINEWVKNKTRGKILDIAGKEISANTAMVILNAVYFKGLWETPFNPKYIFSSSFYNSGSTKVEVKYMTLKARLPYTFEPDLKSEAIELSYRGKGHSMIIVLPRERKGLAELRNAMTVERMSKLHSSLKQMDVRITLPKFDLKTESGLVPALKKLGVGSIFEHADLSGITEDKGLTVSEVKHKAAIEVNEEGTVASAVTKVVMAKSAPLFFFVDHPFLFYILEKATGRVLFLGEVHEL